MSKGDHFTEDEMDGTCRMYRGDYKCIHNFSRKILMLRATWDTMA
jgi:hypothetical protein